jgi:transposase
MQVSTIGIDLAKNVFQVHGVDARGKVVLVRQLRRKQVLDFFGRLPACLVGMEACATAHHWARELMKLRHTVRLLPPAWRDVKRSIC